MPIMSNESKALINKARQTKYAPVTAARKRISKEEYTIREYIEEFRGVMGPQAISNAVSKKMGKKVTVRRIKGIMERVKEEAMNEMASFTSFEAAVEAREEYKRMRDQATRLELEAQLLDDPKEAVELQIKAGKLKLQAREAEDRMYKMAGIHQEVSIDAHIDVTSTEQWKSLQNGILVYLTYALECPNCAHKGFDPDDFIEFMQKLSEDPNYIDQFMPYKVRWRQAQRDYGEEAKKLLREDVINVEAEDGGEG
jgi:hypothetical protein